MRDENERDALAPQPAHDRAEPVDVAAGQARGRLVEQEDARLAEHGARDLDPLLQGEVEVAHLVVQIDVEVERCEVVPDQRLRPAPPDQAEAVDWRVGQQHVVEDGQIPDQRHFLKGSLDAEPVRGPRAGEPHRLAEDADRAGIRLNQAGEQLDDGRLAGAVLTEQGMDLALRDDERHVVRGDRGPERLANALDGDGGSSVQRCGSYLEGIGRRGRTAPRAAAPSSSIT